MCSPNCERVAAASLGAVVVQLSGGNKKQKCCRGTPQNHKGGCISPDPNEFFRDTPTPDTVRTKPEGSDEKEAPKPAQCPCGKTMAACG